MITDLVSEHYEKACSHEQEGEGRDGLGRARTLEGISSLCTQQVIVCVGFCLCKCEGKGLETDGS